VTLILDFSLPDSAALFHPIGDSVMGGISTASLSHDEGWAVFAGTVSFESGGGFASIRSETVSWNLSGFEGLELDVRGDGKVYKMSMTTEPRYDSVVYRARFHAPADGWTRIRLPFSGFTPTVRGETVRGAPPLDPSAVSTLGLLISDRQEGKFQLMIKSIKAY
jgi:hypothetical protein